MRIGQVRTARIRNGSAARLPFHAILNSRAETTHGNLSVIPLGSAPGVRVFEIVFKGEIAGGVYGVTIGTFESGPIPVFSDSATVYAALAGAVPGEVASLAVYAFNGRILLAVDDAFAGIPLVAYSTGATLPVTLPIGGTAEIRIEEVRWIPSGPDRLVYAGYPLQGDTIFEGSFGTVHELEDLELGFWPADNCEGYDPGNNSLFFTQGAGFLTVIIPGSTTISPAMPYGVSARLLFEVPAALAADSVIKVRFPSGVVTGFQASFVITMDAPRNINFEFADGYVDGGTPIDTRTLNSAETTILFEATSANELEEQ